MIYDTHAPYAHQVQLPYAHEPWKALYVIQRLTTTILLVPYWAAYYSFFPRPRPSWSLRQCIFVHFTRRIYKVTEVAGVTFGTRNPEKEPKQGSLRETTFEWVEPLEKELRTGIVSSDPKVDFKRVGVYVWSNRRCETKGGPLVDLTLRSATPTPTTTISDESQCLIGIFFHGGGYCHMSAHENSRTSRIPRRLIKDNRFLEIYAVEYRLLQFAPFPAVVQDAAAVYSHVVGKYLHPSAQSQKGKYKIVLLGDSSGGNLVLALARWIRDEGKLPVPAGLLLFSPSCDISNAFPETPSSYIPRSHASTDYLVDTPEPRALLQRTFLGFKSPASTRVSSLSGLERGWTAEDQVKRWMGRKGKQGVRTRDGAGDVVDVVEVAFEEGRDREGLGEIEEWQQLMKMVHSEYVSPASPQVLRRWGHAVNSDAMLTTIGNGDISKPQSQSQSPMPISTPCLLSSASSSTEHPYAVLRSTSNFTLSGTRTPIPIPLSSPDPSLTPLNLFTSFPRTLVVLSTHERLTQEINFLVRAMRDDAVDARVEWVEDGVHDVCIIKEGWWDRKAVERVWESVSKWVEGV